MVSVVEESLAVAVPLRIDELQRIGGPNDADWARARESADHIAGHGDRLMFGDKRGEAALDFNTVADALAVGAFVPGGSRFGSLRFEATVDPSAEPDPRAWGLREERDRRENTAQEARCAEARRVDERVKKASRPTAPTRETATNTMPSPEQRRRNREVSARRVAVDEAEHAARATGEAARDGGDDAKRAHDAAVARWLALWREDLAASEAEANVTPTA